MLRGKKLWLKFIVILYVLRDLGKHDLLNKFLEGSISDSKILSDTQLKD